MSNLYVRTARLMETRLVSGERRMDGPGQHSTIKYYEIGFDETLRLKSRNLDQDFRGRLRPEFNIF